MTAPLAPRIRTWHPSPDAASMALALSKRMQELACAAIESRGSASIGLAGGSTPMASYADFAKADMQWQKLKLALIDERFVPLTDSQSNEANIANAFTGVQQQLGAWQGLFSASDTISACAQAANRAIQAFGLPFDTTVIGMGGDGHIASLFLESQDYEAAMQPDNPHTVVPIRFHGSDAKTDRLSMSFQALLKTRHVLICITGEQKREVLERSLDGSAPYYAVARFLEAYDGPVDIHWSPA